MKKKHVVKKLVLAKETVAVLDDKQQELAKGGWITYTCPEPEWGCNSYRCTTGCMTIPYIVTCKY